MQRSGTIVIADDDRNDVELLIHALKDSGIRKSIRWVKDGGELISFLNHHFKRSEQMPFLLRIDEQMPKRNALEAVNWIREQPHYLNLWIAVVTGSQNPVQKQSTLQAGANWYLRKTSGFDNLIELINGLVRMETSAAST